jgi:cytochrome c-type biogenesis protein CcmH
MLLADYADVLASQAGGNLEGRPLKLAKAALQLEPDHAMALSLVATAAYKRKDYPEAAQHWQRLLKQLPPESDDAKWLEKTLAEIGSPMRRPARP